MFLDKSLYEIRKTPDRGKGVFARKELPGGTVVADYLGVLRTHAYAAREEKRINALYSMEWAYKDLVIWPTPPWKYGAHTVNHSCMPNTAYVWWKGHTLVVATRRIFKGEELTVSYNVGASGGMVPGLPCLCGTPLCRGTMHAVVDDTPWKPEKFRDADLRVGDEVLPFDTYPALWRDTGDYPIFGAWPRRYRKVTGYAKLPSRRILRGLLRDTGCNLHFPLLGLAVHGDLGHCGRLLIEVRA